MSDRERAAGMMAKAQTMPNTIRTHARQLNLYSEPYKARMDAYNALKAAAPEKAKRFEALLDEYEAAAKNPAVSVAEFKQVEKRLMAADAELEAAAPQQMATLNAAMDAYNEHVANGGGQYR